jgi:hypothetical protein
MGAFASVKCEEASDMSIAHFMHDPSCSRQKVSQKVEEERRNLLWSADGTISNYQHGAKAVVVTLALRVLCDFIFRAVKVKKQTHVAGVNK